MTHWVCRILAAMVGLAFAIPASAEQFYFPFFRGNGEAGVYLAVSNDGRSFESVNEDKPIFTPPQWEQGQVLTRDPSIVHHDGVFHMVWTTAWNGKVFGYANSKDLKTWSEPKKIQPFASDLPQEDQPDNVWAPEIQFDPVQKDFFIVFSSTTPRERRDEDRSSDGRGRPSSDHRPYIIRTKDFQMFTEPKVLFDQNINVIDPQMVFDDRDTEDTTDDRWVMVIKQENNPRRGGKNLRLVYADAEMKCFSALSDPIAGPGSKTGSDEWRTQWAEGPSIVKHGKEWLLYWDAYGNHHYTAGVSMNLTDWEDLFAAKQLQMPRGARHGTVFIAPAGASAFSGK